MEPNRLSVLELTWADGEGGGPDKTILLGTARSDRSRFAITVCYVHDFRRPLGIAQRAAALGIDFVAVPERGRADLSVWRALRQLVRDRKTDVVHAHGYKADLAALMLARTEGAVPLSTVHGFTGQQLARAMGVLSFGQTAFGPLSAGRCRLQRVARPDHCCRR